MIIDQFTFENEGHCYCVQFKRDSCSQRYLAIRQLVAWSLNPTLNFQRDDAVAITRRILSLPFSDEVPR